MIETVDQPPKITPNPKQMECIKTLDGPVMVLAGPGTGKTFTVIQRIKYMLEQGIPPEVILCLTFSEAAANEMKARLVGELGTIASAVVIHTYHAFCNEIIRQYPANFELLDGVGLIDDITKRSIMKDCLDELNPEFYRTKWGDAYYYITELLSAVDEIKKNQVKKEYYFNTLETGANWQLKLDELLADKIEQEEKERAGKQNHLKGVTKEIKKLNKKMDKAREAWAVYEIYDIKLKQNNFIDFNDMINLVLKTFEEDSELLNNVSSQFKYFLVDEYQDTNLSQNHIVFKLAEAVCEQRAKRPREGESVADPFNASKQAGAGNENIFVVGDDDQIIYGFQGAQIDNLERFLLRYPSTKVICLNENNRSTQTILDLSYELIAQDKTRLEINPEFAQYNISKVLTAKNPTVIKKDKKVNVHSFSDLKQENNFIVEDIENIIKSGTAPKDKKGNDDLSQIAILARRNGELQDFADLLKAKNIPFQIKTTKSIFELKPSIITYFYLKALENNEFYSDKLFGLLLSKPFDFAKADYNFLLEQSKLTHKDFITNIKNNINRAWADAEKVNDFIETYDSLNEFKSGEGLKNTLVQIVNQTGILGYFLNLKINKIENIFAIKRLIDEASSFGNLHKTATIIDFINHLDTAFNDKVPITIDSDDYIQNAVQLSTYHGSKGREFEYVYLPNLLAKNWEKGSSKNSTSLPTEKNKHAENEEEAKKAEQLRLLFVGVTRAKHALTLSFSNIINGKGQEFTSYLSSIMEKEHLFNRFTHELTDEELSDEIGKSLTVAQFNHKEALEAEIRARVKDFVLSPSSLNAYLNCPRGFLYSNLLMIHVLESGWDAANYGNAIHKILEWAVKEAKEKGSYPNKETFMTEFSKKLSVQQFEDKLKRDEYEKRGKNSLETYYPRFCETSQERIYALEHKLEFIPVGDKFIKGFIDRVETNNDCTYSLYDYKTGTAKAKSQIAEGKNYESYLNQLRFYKYAFEIQNVGCKVSSVGLVFVEEHDKSFYTTLTEEDNEIIEEKIKSTYKNLDELNFDPIECDEKTREKKCNFCGYKQLCRLDVL